MLGVEQASAAREGDAWRVTWRICNPDSEPVEIMSAWLPHSRFRGAEWRLDPPLALPPGGEVLLESRVYCREQPGAIVENAFVILRLRDLRVFARLCVEVSADGTPRAITETVTAQPAG